MLTTAKVCALLLGGAAVGYTAPIAVKKVSKASVAKPVKPAPHKRATAGSNPATRTNILDCPVNGAAGFNMEPQHIERIGDVQEFYARSSGGWAYSVNPPVGGGFPVSAGEPVPEPDTWVMLIAGFGLVGASMRRRAACQN